MIYLKLKLVKKLLVVIENINNYNKKIKLKKNKILQSFDMNIWHIFE